MVDVRVLFWSITNKIYWEKILPITLYVHKIALPENVTLTYTLSYVSLELSVAHLTVHYFVMALYELIW